MSDSRLNDFVSRGTNAERLVFTPTPPTPAGGNDPGYFFFETDTGDSYAWDGAAWQQVNAGGSFTAASTTEQLTGTEAAKGSTPDSVAALWEQGSNIASAATISIGEGGHFHVTGTTTITDIDPATDKAGRFFSLTFDGALTLTHNASTLILPTGANITTAAGDTALFKSEGSDVVRCVAYTRASGAALASTSAEFGNWTTLTLGSSSSVMGGTYYACNETFTGAAGKTFEMEVEFVRTLTTTADIRVRCSAGSQEAVAIAYQSDGNRLFYRWDGGSNSAVGALGSTDENAGLARLRLIVHIDPAGTSSNVGYGLINDQRMPSTNHQGLTANLIGTLTPYVLNNATFVRGRARLIG